MLLFCLINLHNTYPSGKNRKILIRMSFLIRFSLILKDFIVLIRKDTRVSFLIRFCTSYKKKTQEINSYKILIIRKRHKNHFFFMNRIRFRN